MTDQRHELAVLDFETYFDDNYTLSKMTTEAYIRDPRFEVLGVAIKNGARGEWVAQPAVADFIQSINLPNTTLLCHHAHFDGLILSHHFGIKPARWLDTLSMARYLHGAHIKKSLGSLSDHYGFAEKSVPYDLFKGKHWGDLDANTQWLLASGCLRDCELTYQIFERMLQEGFPPPELKVIDLTVRMFTEPALVGDTKLFEKVRDDEWLKKNQTLYELGVGEKDLASADKFAAILEAEGVEVAYKPGKLGPIPAIAKTDPFMQELLNHEDERIATLAQARLDVRSTLNETRSGRLFGCSTRGSLPVYLNYCAAHTRRWGGGDSINLQNLPRGGAIRRGLRAPDGYLFAAPDQSQGECRILNWLAGQEDVVERFRSGHDPYLPIASKFYGREITKADVAERGTGKQLELSCGFGAGGATIVRTAARGTYGPPVKLSAAQGEQAKYVYRTSHLKVVELWREGEDAIVSLAAKKNFEWRIFFSYGDGKLYHPNGLWLDYSHLKREAGEWRLYEGNGRYRKMYGAKLVENVVQWLSRIVTAEAMVRFDAEGYRVVGMSHDDVWLLVPTEGAEEHAKKIVRIMSRVPDWAPGLPLAADCKIGETYS